MRHPRARAAACGGRQETICRCSTLRQRRGVSAPAAVAADLSARHGLQGASAARVTMSGRRDAECTAGPTAWAEPWPSALLFSRQDNHPTLQPRRRGLTECEDRDVSTLLSADQTPPTAP
eukprot:1241675-Prymnesium_polylepis.1